MSQEPKRIGRIFFGLKSNRKFSDVILSPITELRYKTPLKKKIENRRTCDTGDGLVKLVSTIWGAISPRLL